MVLAFDLLSITMGANFPFKRKFKMVFIDVLNLCMRKYLQIIYLRRG